MNMPFFQRTSLLVASITASQALAAPITWSVHDITGNESDISTAGTLVDARNGGLSDITVNGVTFQSIDKSGNLFDSLFANDNIKGREGTKITGDYQMFLRFGQRSGRPGFGPETDPIRVLPNQPWATVMLPGLTIGNTYQIQIWASDTDIVMANAGSKVLLLGNGAATGPVLGTDAMLIYEVEDGPDTSTWGTGGQYGIGTFVADAATQSFNVQFYANLPTSPKANTTDHFCNGWQLRDLGKGGGQTTQPNPAATPALAVVRLHSTESKMTLEFNQPLHKASAANPDNYTISLKGGGTGTVSGASLSGDSQTVTLTFGIPLVIDGSTYIIEFENLSGADGKPMKEKKAVEFSP
jgi:hypothetical protein